MILLIVRNPLDRSSIERIECDSPSRAIREAFPIWPSTARIYDLEGVGDPERAMALIVGPGLQSRDITPQDQNGIDRVENAAGPLMVTIPPADPLTAIIAVAATLLAVAAAYLLLPKVPTPDQAQSSNRSLSDRSNKPRPGGRIPDIYGTVRSVPDLLSVPYRRFENNLELEISFMCVGRGSYEISDVRDGDTLLTSVAGAAASFYAPGTSPNRGDAPQLRIGSPIADQVQTIVPMAGVNGQLLRPPNSNNIIGSNNIRFTAPDIIETNSTSIDFTKNFDTDDQITVGSASFGGQTYYDYVNQPVRFYPDKTVEFQSFDPTTVFFVGETVTLNNAIFTGSGGIAIDLSGTYVVAELTNSTMKLTDP